MRLEKKKENWIISNWGGGGGQMWRKTLIKKGETKQENGR